MFISFIVTLTVGVLCAIFLGMLLPSVFNTIGIASAYPYATPFIFSAIFAAVYFYVHKSRSGMGYGEVAKEYPDGGYSLSGDLNKIVRSERGFYTLVGVGAFLGWFFRLIDTAVTSGLGGSGERGCFSKTARRAYRDRSIRYFKNREGRFKSFGRNARKDRRSAPRATVDHH